MRIPTLLDNGLLPPGLYLADMDEIFERFGQSTARRQNLFERLRIFVELAQHCGALRMFVNGSFVTDKPEPGDVDVVIWLGESFRELLLAREPQALLLQQMMLKRQPEEAFFVADQNGWDAWFEFFSIFKQDPQQRKGLIEVHLK
jgi:hypothetical protein